MFLTSPQRYLSGFAAPTSEFRSLNSFEQVKEGDIIEDIHAGDRVKVGKGTFYGVLKGQTARQVKQLPAVYDVLRRL